MQAYSTMEEHTCLLKENSSNLLLANGMRERSNKEQSRVEEVTMLGPGNMALATPAMKSDEETRKAKRKIASEKMERLEDQVTLMRSVYVQYRDLIFFYVDVTATGLVQ